MPKQVSTPKQSGAGGITFEDEVSASFLLKMLSGVHPLTVEVGQIESVRFQKRVDGWFLDDVVLFLRDSAGIRNALAISVKSNQQITKDGFPEEFTRAIWEQSLHIETEEFDICRDYLALATPPLDGNVKTKWEELVKKAIDADAEKFASRIATHGYSNEIERALLTSLHCPDDIDKSKTAVDTVNLLKRLRLFEVDFTRTPSQFENEYVLPKCVELLKNGGIVEAESLWTHLKQISRRFASSGGDLTRTQLADLLRPTFSLNEFPNYVQDWIKLADEFTLRTELIDDQLAGRIHLPNTDFENLQCDQNIAALIGASGSGKTVLAKQIATETAKTGHAVWLTAADLNNNSLSVQFADLGLRYGFPELISESLIRDGVIVIDGFERLSLSGMENLAKLLKRTQAGSDTSPWSFLFTCVVDSWERTLRALQREYGAVLDIEVKTISFRLRDHLSTLADAFPILTRMLQRSHLAPVFRNLKILDLVLANIRDDTDTSAWIGETDIIDWYWEQIVRTGEDGSARSRFLQKLACIEADELLISVPIGDFSSDECKISPRLVAEQVIWDRDENYGFEHDLFEDWARTRFLLSRQHEISTVAQDKALNPRWHRAIRLYGLRLLENRSYDIDQWRQLIVELSPCGKQTLESNLILESVLFAANAEDRLAATWEILCESEGLLLNRLLTGFLHVATLPDPVYVQDSDDTAVAALYRYPYWPLWLPVIRFLFDNRAEAIRLATDQVTKIADLWLKQSPDDWALRDKAGRILIDAAEHVIEEINEKDWHVDSELCATVFSRLLTAAYIFPDEVSRLALALAERSDDSLFPRDHMGGDDESEDDGLKSFFNPRRGPLPPPWPDGPRRRIQHSVHDGFLRADNPLQYLFAVRPEVGREVLLALLIREPISERVPKEMLSGILDEFLHISRGGEFKWHPAMFFHGPFLTFLRTNSKQGIETIVALTNFVTHRWIDNREPPPPPVIITINGEVVHYYGSSEAYYWYRDAPRSPDSLVSALMALERWLYDCIEQEMPTKPAIDQILKTSQSTALLGVLAATGRKYPSLFKDELRELVPLSQLQMWEENYKIHQTESLLEMTMMSWSRWGERIFNMVRDWHTFDHRKTTLNEVLFQLFITDEEFRSRMEDVRTQWKDQLAILGESDDANCLERFILQFDENNWSVREVDEGIALDFVEPEERRKRLSSVREANDRHMEVLMFPRSCRTKIDERKQMNSEELATFWQQLQSISDNADQARDEGDTPEDAILGGVAVLFILHKEWIEADKKRETWCFDQVCNVLENPPPHPQLHFAESISNSHWDNFVAMMLPQFLSTYPTDEVIRTICAQCALAFNYCVIADLMNFAYENRLELTDDFLRLQNLILTSSGIRHVAAVTQDSNSIWNCPDVRFDIGARYNELIAAFAKSTLSIDLPSLCDVAVESTDIIVDMVRQQHEVKHTEPYSEETRGIIANRIKQGWGFEPLLIRAGFSWVGRIDEESDSNMRAQIVETLENILHGFLGPLGGIVEALQEDQEDDDFYAIPGDWVTWVFDLIATLIPKLEVAATARKLWEPILDLGLDRVHWVDSFLSAWFIHGLKVQGREGAFFYHWREMIDYAWTQEKWFQTEIRSHHWHGKLFRHLMGFSSFGHGYYEDVKYQPFITEMKPEFERWTEAYFPHPEVMSYYAQFLIFPSAVDHLRDGVHRLAQRTSEIQERHWSGYYHLDRSMMDLLEYDWKNNFRLIKSDSAVWSDFSTILKILADRQFSRALELQDRVARTV